LLVHDSFTPGNRALPLKAPASADSSLSSTVQPDTAFYPLLTRTIAPRRTLNWFNLVPPIPFPFSAT
jgi:hypothetical protein